MPDSPSTRDATRPRPAAVVNAEIRDLAGRVVLTAAERRTLAELWTEWQAAVNAERTAA